MQYSNLPVPIKPVKESLTPPIIFSHLAKIFYLYIAPKAYFRLAQKYHPDKNPEGREMFEAVNKAYEFICSRSAKKVDGPDPHNIVLILKTQSILFNGHKEGKTLDGSTRPRSSRQRFGMGSHAKKSETDFASAKNFVTF